MGVWSLLTNHSAMRAPVGSTATMTRMSYEYGWSFCNASTTVPVFVEALHWRCVDYVTMVGENNTNIILI